MKEHMPQARPTDEFGAAFRGEQFREAIESYLKHVDPRDYLPWAAAKLHEVLESDNRKLGALFPPHWLLHSMEANCRHYRQGRSRPLEPRWLNRLFNVYRTFCDPFATHVLSEDDLFSLFVRYIFRQQLLLQKRVTKEDLARARMLYLDQGLQKTRRSFEEELGFSIEDWMTVCVVIYGAVSARNTVTIPISYLHDGVTWIPRDRIDAVLQLLAYFVRDLATESRRLRSPRNGHLEGQLPSLLEKRPLVWLDSEWMVVTHREYLLARAIHGVFELCRSHFIHIFDKEITGVFQRYVGQVLQQIPGAKIYGEQEIAPFVAGKICDFAVATPHEVLLVEAKAVNYTSLHVTETRIKEDSSTRQITKGMQQLANVADAVRTRHIEPLLGSIGDRPLLGMVVTYGDLFLTNDDFTWNLVLPDAFRTGPAPFRERPQVIDIASLEVLVGLAINGHPIADEFRAKILHSVSSMGDWSSYVRNRRQEAKVSIPDLEPKFFEFYDRILEASSIRLPSRKKFGN